MSSPRISRASSGRSPGISSYRIRGRYRGGPGLSDLPKNARDYVARVEEILGVPAIMISVGAERTETIIRRHPFTA